MIRAILRHQNELLIKPAENPNFIERLFGSGDMQLLRNCPCPVWLTRIEEKSNYACILEAVDIDPDTPDETEQNLNRQILVLSSSLAKSKFAALNVLHVWGAPFEKEVQSWSDSDACMAYVNGE